MGTFNDEYMYSLYNPDNGVEIYDSLEEAERVKDTWLQVGPVDGPFTHTRPEASMISVARRAVNALTELRQKHELTDAGHQLQAIVAELKAALDDLVSPIESS